MDKKNNLDILLKIEQLQEDLSLWKKEYKKNQNLILKKIKTSIIKIISLFCIIASASFASFNLIKNYVQSKQKKEICNKYVSIVKESIYNSLNNKGNIYLLEKASALCPENEEVKHLLAYIKIHDAINILIDENILNKEKISIYKELKTELKDLIYTNPSRSELYVLDSLLSISREDWANAKKSLDIALTNSPCDAYATARLAYYYLKKGDIENAKENINKALMLDEKNNKFIYHINGLIKYKLGKIKEAIDSYSKVLSIDPYYTPAIYNLAFIYIYKHRDIQKAKQLIDLHLKLSSDDKHGMMLLGGLFQTLELYDEAIFVYEKVLAKDADFYPAMRAKAIIYRDKFEYEKSLSEFYTLIKADPKNADKYFFDIAEEIFIVKKDYKSANYYINKALKINPSSKRGLKLKQKIINTTN